METVDVFVETQLDTKTSFGVRVDNGESVFINARLSKKHNIVEDETYTLVLLPNAGSDNSNTPWKAMGVSMTNIAPDLKETPRVVVAKLEDRIMDMFKIEANQFAHTAADLAEEMGVGDTEMQLVLSRMHNAGEMAKAQVYARGKQDKASTVLWAPDMAWFSL
jgi:F420-0:gamma-glutamyl ligase